MHKHDYLNDTTEDVCRNLGDIGDHISHLVRKQVGPDDDYRLGEEGLIRIVRLNDAPAAMRPHGVTDSALLGAFWWGSGQTQVTND